MNIIVHRGSNQIGGSCIEVFTEKTRIILDIGQELPSLDPIADRKISIPPKVQGLYLGEEKTIDAILVSHGHGDHIGLIGDINREIPVYIGKMAADIFEVTSKFTGGVAIASPFKYLESGVKFHVGDFKITPYLVDHSGFDAYAFLIESHNKAIVYTGDFRGHGRKVKATDYFINHIPKGIDGLFIEGTMMSRVGERIKTEEEIEKKVYKLMKETQGPLFVLQSSTNIDRLVSMYRAAKKSGRIFIMDVFTAHIVSKLNSSIPNPKTFKDVWVFYPYWLNKRMCKSFEGAKLMNEFSS
ncbi:MAG TPA: MBL fold metallo-hydrolase, partial [Epulopiscium sp.]|nr:MBL fold metallo-hydrolase [Candidatus Epulonipiscium sp.]